MTFMLKKGYAVYPFTFRKPLEFRDAWKEMQKYMNAIGLTGICEWETDFV